jgi:biopolymer transport protein ExbD
MRLPVSRRGGEVGINMTPMIDVVFQLIIFFMLSSRLAKQEAQLELPLPTAGSIEKINQSDDQSPRITVNVLADGEMQMAGRTIPVAELVERLQERRTKIGPEMEVRIRGARDVAYRHVEPIMLACARVGIWKVNYAVYRKEDAP